MRVPESTGARARGGFGFPIWAAMCLSFGRNFARVCMLLAAVSASRKSSSCSGEAVVINCAEIASAMPGDGGTGGPPMRMLAALFKAPVRARTPAAWA